MKPFSRRQLIALGAATAAGATVGHWTPVAARNRRSAGVGPFDGDPFAIGVTSGDPDETSAVLWTRLTRSDGGPLDEPDIAVGWELADDETFTSIETSGEVVALADEGHSVHAIVDLAGPAFFRFRTGDWVSPVGRVAPTPGDGSAADLKIATASCQHFETGFFAAYRDIVEWQPDLVVFLGDFIYEYAATEIAGTGELGIAIRSHIGDEIFTVDQYRTRYAQYLSDADLRAARAACPWLVIWDDHEVENNYAALTPEVAAESPDFAGRRLAAYQAWWEHMPVRMARPTSGDDFTIYRSVTWGDLAHLILLDGRQYRSDQACGDIVLDINPPCAEALEPQRTMLGVEQEQWLIDELAASTATWAVVGQQTVVTNVRLPNGAILNYDQWDGYDPARQRLLLAAAQADRVVVLTGDIHLAATGVLRGVGVEFVTTSISSTGLLDPGLEATVSDFADVVAAELVHRGYTRHVVTPEGWTAEFRIVEDVTSPDSPVSTWRTFFVDPLERDTVLEHT